ncbi:MAG: STAS/SEC14 domain-containing protein [Dokdonella sp.]
MIKLLAGLPDNVVGISASGHVSASDYETVLAPAVEAALKKNGKARLLYVLGSDFTGLTPGAMWEDAKLGIAHFTAWEKVALVTDVGWVANAANIFRFVMPCPVQVFSTNDQVKAEAWVVA